MAPPHREPLALPPGWLEIGRVVGPQGLRGEVRVYPNSDFPERFFLPGSRGVLRPGQAEPEMMTLVSGRFLDNKGLYLIQFEEVRDRDQAETLRNAVLVVAEGDRLPTEPDEFHVADLIGLSVRMQSTGDAIGTVVDVYTAGNDLLAVALDPVPESSQPPPVLIPFVHEIVPVVDLAAGIIEITPPQGLIPDRRS